MTNFSIVGKSLKNEFRKVNSTNLTEFQIYHLLFRHWEYVTIN